jgi:cytosine/adenosine deaminase-related metal-dependent hydrolase
MIIEGRILRGPEFEEIEGRVVVEDGEITAVEEATVESGDIVLPAFVNAHTHIGDSVAKEAGAGLSLDELVAPPDGLKHQLLRAADRSEMIAAMRRSVEFIEQCGTGSFADFREGGVEGVEAFREAVVHSDVRSLAYGRGDASVLDVADGYGASGARDDDFSQERTAAREAGKPFGIHAGERDPMDINPAIDLDPDLLVHMTHAEPLHLDRVEDSDIPVVVCPRSNLATDVGIPPVGSLTERTTVALGTDNVFLTVPSMFREMAVTQRLCDVSAREVLEMATVGGAEALGLDCGRIEPGADGRILVLDGESDNLAGAQDLIRAVVRRATVADVASLTLPRT